MNLKIIVVAASFLLVALFTFSGCQPISAPEDSSEKELEFRPVAPLAERLNEDRDREEAADQLIEAQRLALVNKLVEQLIEDKRLAELDLQDNRFQQQDVRSERDLKIAKLETLKRKVELKNASRKYVMGIISVSDEPSSVDFETVSNRMDLLKRSRENWLGKGSPISASSGAINSGRALNSLLEVLGPIAVRQAWGIQQFQEHEQDLRRQLTLSQAISADSVAIAELEQELFQVSETLKILRKLDGRPIISKSLFNSLRLKKGHTDNATEVSKTPLQINWSAIESLSELDVSATRDNFENARERALKEITESGGVTPATLRDICETFEELESAIKRYYKRYLKGRTMADFEVKRYYRSVAPDLKQMRRELGSLPNIESVSDFGFATEFEGDTINGLLAFLSNNGATFVYDPSGANQGVDSPNHIVYHEMLNYLAAIESLQFAMDLKTDQFDAKISQVQRQSGEQINRLESVEDRLLQKKYEKLA